VAQVSGAWVFVKRRPTFADQQVGDVVPVTRGNPPESVGSVPGKTFQVAPSPKDGDGSIPQTPHEGGMLTAFVDGSVRTCCAGPTGPACAATPSPATRFSTLATSHR